MKHAKVRALSLVLMLAIMLGMIPGMDVNAYALDEIYFNVGQSRQIPLGATILTGRLTSGTWTISNPNVAEITSQSAGYANVKGMNPGRTNLSCYYKYYIGGTYISSYWNCTIVVTGSGSSSGGSSSGGSSGPIKLVPNKTSLSWDMAKSKAKQSLYFDLTGNPNMDYYLSLDVRDGYPTKVYFYEDCWSENDSPVFLNMQAGLTPRSVGSETIYFQIVHRKYLNGAYRFYNTGIKTVPIEIEVTCSHKYVEKLVQKGTAFQSEIKEFTCSACNDKRTEETLPVFGKADYTLPTDILTIKESAFEGADMSSVYIPDSCKSIGAYAFRNCRDLEKIRLPKDCEIHPLAFEGCKEVYIFAQEGGTTQKYCTGHAICKYVQGAPE